ncbi:MAG: hypothetical protein EXS35_00115 [Pedosphaera sp.]|nr:hypothetical protein [Pedosphaera sp.]
MKISLLFSAALGLVLVGCGDSSNKPAPGATNAPASSGSPLTAPVDYLKSATDARHDMVKTVDVTSVNKAIEMFNVQEGHFPKELNELVTKKYIPLIPTPPFGSKLEYDATAGTVKVVKQ